MKEWLTILTLPFYILPLNIRSSVLIAFFFLLFWGWEGKHLLSRFSCFLFCNNEKPINKSFKTGPASSISKKNLLESELFSLGLLQAGFTDITYSDTHYCNATQTSVRLNPALI